MKCPMCNGKGTQFIADYDGMYDIVCYKCKGKGELDENGKPILTNEEYLRSCNMEELATFLAIVQYDGTDLTLKKNHVEKWVEWLKQPHTPKE